MLLYRRFNTVSTRGTVKLHGVSLTALVRSGPKHGDTYLAASATSLQSWGTVLRAEAEGSNYIYFIKSIKSILSQI